MARLLLVDDDRDILDLGSAVLESAGHSVLVASNAIDALKCLRDYAIDLLITDAGMPDVSGYELVKTLRKDPAHLHLTVAMLTAKREKRDIERAVEAGVHDYIVKPLDPALLIRKVEAILQRRPPREREIETTPAVRVQIPARVRSSIEIVQVSESGLIVRSVHPLTEGERIEIESEALREMGLGDHPIMEVASVCEFDGAFEATITLFGASDRVLAKLRAWIQAHAARRVG